MNIGFIGAGKVGFSLGKYFAKDKKTNIVGYYSKSRTSAQEAAEFTNSKCYESISALLKDCNAIFITVPDNSICDIWNEIKKYEIRGKIICHCSGSMSSQDSFLGIKETGAFGYSAHPLFAVSDKYNAYRELTDVFFAVETGENSPKLLEEMFHRLGNPIGRIRSEDKITYHCAAAMASNLVCGLIDQSVELLKRCGLSEKQAISALGPILTGNMEHIANDGPVKSLTGPIERNDIETVQKHLHCLTAEDEREIYRLLSTRLVDMAKQRHLDRDYAEMSKLLRKGE